VSHKDSISKKMSKEGKGKEEAVEKSSRKEGLKQLTSTLLWDLRNDNKLTPALDQRVDQLEQKLLAKYCTQEAGWYSDNLQYMQAFQGLAREVVDARKCMREEEQEDQEAVVEEGIHDTMSFDTHALSPDLEELEPVSSSSSRVFFHKPIPIYASRQPSHSTPRPFPSASTGFPAQQAEGCEAQVKVEEEVQQEVRQVVEEDVKQEVDEDMQQHIISVLCKGRADGGISGGAGGEAQEKACNVNKKRPDTSDDEACQGRGKAGGAAGPKHEQTEMRYKELRLDCEARNLSREERKMMVIMRQIEEM
jgi:hypothetical protein